MWCTGAFVACSAVNAFVSLLLRTQDLGNDNTWRLSGLILALHTVGTVQSFSWSGIYAYVQWACSAPLLTWLLVQLLGTLPPGCGTPSATRLYRVAILELVLASVGLFCMLFVRMNLVCCAVGIVSASVLSLELLPLAAPHLLAHLSTATGGSSATAAGGGILGPTLGFSRGALSWLATRLSGISHSSNNSGAMSSFQGNSGGWGSQFTPRAGAHDTRHASGVTVQRHPPGGAIGAASNGGLGFAASAALGAVPAQSLPAPMEALVRAVAGGKLLQAIAAAAISTVSPGGGLTPPHGASATVATMIWSLSTAVTLYGLPLAIGIYYCLIRYAANMLIARRSTLRRVSSLGGMVVGLGPGTLSAGVAASYGDEGSAGSQAPRSSPSSLSLALNSMRRAAAYGGGADSDSDSGLPILSNRLLEVGDLYRITESSGHSISYSTSGDEGWRTDLALTQLLYMARTTFQRNSSDEPRPADGGASGGGGGFGGVTGPLGSPLTSSRRSSPPLPLLQTANACIQTEHRVSFGSRRCETGVQCDIGPSTIIKEVPVEVPVEVPTGLMSTGDGGPLMSLIQALREHSSDIAHDMKNPLNGVLALSQNVLQGTFGELPPSAADQLGVVRACAYHLLNMINQLRDCMRMLHGGEPDGNCGRVQLSNAIEEVLKRMSPMVGSRLTIRAEHDPSLVVYADDGRLYQSVHTVLANAFKYTRKGGVTIETVTSADKTAVTLRVTDTGSGFTAEQLEKFNNSLTGSPEEQLGLGLTMVKRTMAYFGGILRLGNRSGGGSGGWVEMTFRTKEDVAPLGAGLPPPPSMGNPVTATARTAPLPQSLMPSTTASTAAAPAAPPPQAATIPPTAPQVPTRDPAKKIRKSMMGGADKTVLDERLAAANSSNDRNGSRGPSSASAAAGAAPSARGGGGAACSTALTGGINDDALIGKGDELVRILIVDDDPVNLTILEDLLRAEGYDVLTAASGTEALEAYLTSDPQPKLVLLDVTLPDMSGHEVCLKMRSLTPGVPPPIIMISGKASTKDVIKGLQAGACDYITKPFQPQEVMARVETQLRMFMGEVAQLQEAAERNMALLRQILPPHILASLRGGTRVLVEKFNDVVVLCADVVGFSALAAAADTTDCILTLNRLFSTFDTLTDKMGVHKMDCHTDSYVAALGHMPQDRQMSNVMQVKQMLELAREMLAAVDSLPYPDTLGKMQIRVGVHVGAVYGGVIGVKYPRYSLFGTTLRLAQGLQSTALPNTIHVTEVVHNRVRAAGGETFMPYTTSQVQSLGIIRTYLVGAGPDGGLSPGMLDYSHLETSVVMDYLRSATAAAHGMTILNCLIGGGAAAGSGTAPAVAASGQGLGLGLSAGPMVSRPALGPGAVPLPAATQPLPQLLSPAATPATRTSTAGMVSGGGGGGGGGGGPSGYKIIPVISNRHLSVSGTGDTAASGGSTVGGSGMAGSGSNFVGPSRSRDSDASGYAITLAQVPHVTLDATSNEIVSSLAAAASGDVGTLLSMELGNMTTVSSPPVATSGNASSNSASAAGITSGAGNVPSGGGSGVAAGSAAVAAVHGYPSAAAVGVSGFSGSGSVANNSVAGSAAPAAAATVAGSSRRHNSDASLVQDLSPGPPAAGLMNVTRMQRLHAGSQQLSGSGAVSPRPSGGPSSRAGSRGPSRNTSFRLGGSGGSGGGVGGIGGGASPLAATLMQQQLLTAFQQQQQHEPLPPQQRSGVLRVIGHHLAAPGEVRLHSTEESVVFLNEVGITKSPQSASEPLMKLQPAVVGASEVVEGNNKGDASTTGARGISSATMRRIHVPPKAASIGALPGGGGGGHAGVVASGIRAVGSSLADSVSAGGMSTAGSLGSPLHAYSPTALQPPVQVAGGAVVAAVTTPVATTFSASSPYAGLSSETRARLARLRTASQPDLHDASTMGSFSGVAQVGGAATAAAATTSIEAITSALPISPDAIYPAAPSSAEYGGAHSLRHAGAGPAPSSTLATLLTSPIRTVQGGGGGASGAPLPMTATGIQQAHRRPPHQRPTTVSELLDSLGLGHYSRSIMGAVSGDLGELASLDDNGLRKVGLMSSRSRQLVRDELTRWGYK